MAGIKGKNTKPERTIRTALHKRGLRYRLHSKSVPGRPDLVFPRYRAVIFVHGCFWHAHACSLFRLPETRRKFWKNKIYGNRARDRKVRTELEAANWRHLIIWECALRGKDLDTVRSVIDRAERWLRLGGSSREIKGNN